MLEISTRVSNKITGGIHPGILFVYPRSNPAPIDETLLGKAKECQPCIDRGSGGVINQGL
jgi:hypothetical protein